MKEWIALHWNVWKWYEKKGRDKKESLSDSFGMQEEK